MRFDPLVRCPGPRAGTRCEDGALVEAGKRCLDCRHADERRARRRPASNGKDGHQ